MNRLLPLAASALLSVSGFAGPLDVWHWLYPQPTGFSLSGVAHGAGQFIAVGEGTTILRSTDGTNWSAIRTGAPGTNLNGVAWVNGQFMAVGQGGLILTSSDGTNWASRRPLSTDLYSVAFGAGRFVAVGGDVTTNWVQTSVDGITWAVVTNFPTPPLGNPGPMFDVTWGERFVAVAAKGIFLSDDGVSWQKMTNALSFYELAGVTYANGLYVAVGPYSIVYSTNGIHWRNSSAFIGHYHTDVAGGNNRHVIVGDTGLAGYSSNAETWTSLGQTFNRSLSDIVYADGRFVAVGEVAAITTSVNGTNWTRPNGPPSAYSIACGGGGCVVIADDGSKQVTANFIDWTVVETNQFWSGVKYLNGRFIAPGDTGLVHVGTSLLDWNTIATSTTNRLFGAAFGLGRYIVSGQKGTLAISSNAFDWNVVQLAVTNDLSDIVFGNDRFIAADYFGHAAVSTNGSDWMFPPALPPYFRNLTYGNGVFLLLNSTGSVLRTTDGFSWSLAYLRTNGTFVDAALVNGTLVIAGYGFEGGSLNAYLLASRDATNWSHHPLPLLGGAVAGVTGFGDAVIVNGYSRFIQSGAFPRLSITAPLRLSLAGTAGNYQIQSSADVVGPWQTITNLAAPGEWTIANTNGPKRFYRAIAP